MTKWTEIADGVFIRRHVELDQTLGLVVGAGRCLVIDTGTDEVHGGELAAAVREVTALPWTVLVTHAHWDHFFGTAPFLPCSVLAHPRCALEIAGNAEQHRARGLRNYPDDPVRAARLAEARVVVPDTPAFDLDLGNRPVELRHLGRGHTDHDVVVHVPDASVVFAGDLVEQGAPPAIGGDAYPHEWPSTLDAVLGFAAPVVVPGHGDPVDPAFVAAQRDELAVVARLCDEVAAGTLPVEQALAQAPYPPDYLRTALTLHR